MVSLLLDCVTIEQRTDIITAPPFFADHSAAIYVKIGDKPQRVGTFGVMHPTVLKNFELPFPVSAMEIELEWFL